MPGSRSRIAVNLAGNSLFVATSCDSEGEPLDGRSRYTVALPRQATQEPNGTWSLSVLESDRTLDPGPENRSSIGTHTANLWRDSDGSLTLYLQPDSPGRDKEPNWLLSPPGAFDLILHTHRLHAMPHFFRSWLPLAVHRVLGASRKGGGDPDSTSAPARVSPPPEATT
jgi:hypothetical protein